MKAGLQVLRGTLATLSATLSATLMVTAAWADASGHPDQANASLGNVNRIGGIVRAEADKAKAAAAAAKVTQEKKDVAGTEAQATAAKASYEAAFSNFQEAAAHAGLCDGQARGCWGGANAAVNAPICLDKVNACAASLGNALIALNEARDAAFSAVKQATRATGGTFSVEVAAAEATGTKGQVAELRTLTEKLAEDLKKDSEAALAASGELGKAMEASEEMAPSLKKLTAAAIKNFGVLLAQVDKLTNTLKRTAVGALDDEDAANVKRLAIAIRTKPTIVADYKAALLKEGGAAAKFEADLSGAGVGPAADHFKNSREGLQKIAQHGDRLLAAVGPVAKANIAKKIADTTAGQYTKVIGDAKESLLKIVELIGKMKDQQSGEDSSAADTPPEEPKAAEEATPEAEAKPAEETPAAEAAPAADAEKTDEAGEEKKAEESADTPPEDAAEKPAEDAAEKPAEEAAEAPAAEKADESADTPPEDAEKPAADGEEQKSEETPAE